MKRHILFIVENSTFPSDVRVRRESEIAKKMGFSVSVISPASDIFRKKFEVIEGVEIYRHNTCSANAGKFGFVIEYLVAFIFEFLLSLKIFIKKPFHIIHTANPPDFSFLIGLFYKVIGVKFIFDHHDLAPELYLTLFSGKKDFFYKIQYLFEKLSCRFADAIISTNESYKKIVAKRHRVNPDKIFVVRNDPVAAVEIFDPKVFEHKSNGRKKLLFLGTINPQDGVNLLLKVLYYLVNQLNEKSFICNIVGRGDSLDSAEQMAKSLELENYVDFKGYEADKGKVRDYLFSSDICLEPAPNNYLNRHSTFIKVMEYMSAGKPIVAFDLKETRYSTGGNAILVKDGQIKEFARAVQKLISDSDLREALGEAGKKRIIEKLNWESASLNLERAYNSI
jgi:glycosyltransferase involved in cell wall biosynthesis